MSVLAELIDQLTALPADKLREAVEMAEAVTKGMVWVPSPGPQTQCYFSRADETFYGGQAGGGKGFRKSQKVLTPFGWRALGDLRTGSVICGTDGTVQRIIGYYERGIQPLYRLRWSDGAETVCDADHIWLGWIAGQSRKIANVLTSGESGAAKWTTKAIADHYARGDVFRFAIPVVSAPCVFNVHGENRGPHKHIKRSIPSYVLGVLLGDGHIVSTGSFTSGDREIAARCEYALSEAAGGPVNISRYEADGRCDAYRIPNAYVKGHLADLGLLGTHSNTKFIPRIYLFATVEERWELLRGLMDTDGTAEEDGDCYFTTVSKQLADDVRHLARSLGAIVTVREKIPTYGHNGEKRKGQLAYTLRVKMPDAERMFGLERKAIRCRGKSPQSMAIFLESIEPCGEDETVCIAVSNPNSLFITEDFRVTHNTDLGLGLALTAHKRTLFLRRINKDAVKVVSRLEEVLGGRDGYNGQLQRWKIDAGQIDIAGCEMESDKQRFKGDPHDLIVFDEGTDFLESQFRFIIGWNRSSDPGQRCRVLVTSNPPTTAEGQWVISYWAPWLDATHPNPAKPGELRWFTTVDGKDCEVDGPGPHIIAGELKPIRARSRTYIPAALSDNPYLADSGYDAVLAALPDELRRAYRDGDFSVGLRDADYQVIPTQWIIEAQARWKPDGHKGLTMTAAALDIGAGRDETVLSTRYGGWYAPLECVTGEAARDPAHAAGLCVKHRRDGCPVVVDVGGGFGGASLLVFKENGIACAKFNGAGATTEKTKDGTLGFYNDRAKAYWRFREELDPGQQGGSAIALPPDAQLRSDLASATWKLTTRGILVESKEDIKKRLGRSTDRGDAIIMALSEGSKAAARAMSHRSGFKPKVVMAPRSSIRRK